METLNNDQPLPLVMVDRPSPSRVTAPSHQSQPPFWLEAGTLLSQELTLKHRETHGCVVSTVATDALVLKHQAISIHNAD